tara:strand:- start:107888 stop:108883 length:996 start_codon:yes stop_codon:yes gene_type:complete
MRTREILTAVGTLACAVGIGFIMQNSDTAEKRYGKAVAPKGASLVQNLGPKSASNALLEVEGITLTSAEFDRQIDIPATDPQVAKASAPQSMLPTPSVPGGAVTPTCEITANARAVAAAMVNLTLDAPCLPNERMAVHHNGMIFTETTSATGHIDLTVPALAQEAVFILAFTNGDGAVAQTTVEELATYKRVVLQWKGQTGFEIHAREFGADYGDDGHVWSGAPRDMAAAVTGQGGFISRLGDTAAAEPLMAEVYSFPISATERSGDVALSVEAEVTQANCGIEIEAQSLELVEGGKVKTQNLTLAVPECDAIGNFLVLNNLLQDLKVAHN